MTVTASLEHDRRVSSVHLADGKLVQLGGAIDEDALDQLRQALLVPLAGRCRDVVVDAGEVTDVTDQAVAVLLAARSWAEEHGARFLLSRSAPALDASLADLDLLDALPRLGGGIPPLAPPAAVGPVLEVVPAVGDVAD